MFVAQKRFRCLVALVACRMAGKVIRWVASSAKTRYSTVPVYGCLQCHDCLANTGATYSLRSTVASLGQKPTVLLKSLFHQHLSRLLRTPRRTEVPMNAYVHSRITVTFYLSLMQISSSSDKALITACPQRHHRRIRTRNILIRLTEHNALVGIMAIQSS